MARKARKSAAIQRARLLGLMRVGIGVSLMAAPGAATRVWLGRADGSSAHARAAARSLGVRDLAIGVGTLVALDDRGPVRGWIEAGVLADAADAANALLFFRGSPPLWRLLWVAAPAAVALYGAALADELG